VEFTLEEIVRTTTNIPPDVPGTTAIGFDLMCLAELLEQNVENLITDLQENQTKTARKGGYNKDVRTVKTATD
jgi:hypothetical protein